MSHDHVHHHDIESMGDRRLLFAIVANMLLTVAQVVGGIVSGSLSLIADALHNFSDASALLLAWLARRIGRQPADELRTFGYQRAEVIAALVNLVQPAVFAHAVYTTDDHFPVEIQAEQKDVLSNWLSERMHTSIRAPDLAGLGFDLVGGRLLPSTNRMAAQFMYQDAGGERITLYVRRIAWENQQAAFQYYEAEGVGVFYWIEGPMGYALSGSLGKKRLIAIAEAAQDSFAGGV